VIKIAPIIEKKHVLNNHNDENLLHKKKSPKLEKNMVGGKNIAKNAKKHVLNNHNNENLLHKKKSPKLEKNMVGGKNIAKNAIPKIMIGP